MTDKAALSATPAGLREALSDAVKRAGLDEMADALAFAILDGTFADATEEQVRHAVYELTARAATPAGTSAPLDALVTPNPLTADIEDRVVYIPLIEDATTPAGTSAPLDVEAVYGAVRPEFRDDAPGTARGSSDAIARAAAERIYARLAEDRHE